MTGTKTGTIVPEAFTASSDPEVSGLRFEIGRLRKENDQLRQALALADKGAVERVWLYDDKRAGHPRAFASEDAANRWFEQNDPEGVAFAHEVEE